MPQELQTRTKLKVSFHECDPMQIVWHGNYLKYFEEGREDFGNKYGVSYRDIKSKGLATPIVKTLTEHKLPLSYGDEFIVETSFVDSAAAKITFKYRILKEEKIVCTGETVQVFTDESGNLMLNNPPFFLDWKKKMGLM